MQTDPIGYDDGMNVYAYALNDPVNFVDPWGLWGLGGDAGGSLNAFGFRISFDLELRFIKDSNKSWFDFSAYSGGLTYTYSGINSYTSEGLCDTDFSLGFEADVGTSLLVTNANHISQLLGSSRTEFGGSGGFGPYGANFEFTKGLDEKGNETSVWEASGGVTPMWGYNYGAESHAFNKNKTNAHPVFLYGE